MLKLIQDEGAIARYQKQFIRRFKPFVDEKIPVKVGHQGASFTAKVLWSNRLGIWRVSPKSGENRYGHIFGTGKPLPASHVPIACEMNFPSSGIDRKIGAAFARDHRGRIFVIHRGKIGGGQKGIGKTLFENRYRGVWVDMDEEGSTVAVAVVGDLDSPRFPRQVAHFVHKIVIIKEAASVAASSQMAMHLDAWQFSPELTGERHEDLHQNLSGQCDHGVVVRDLAAALKAIGLKAGNDTDRDLFALNRENRMTAVFQVCTDTHLMNIHEGIGRLLISKQSLNQPCRLILAVPAPVEPILCARIKNLDIETMTYEWQNEQALFPDLERLMTP